MKNTFNESQVDTALCIAAWFDEVTLLNSPQFRADWDRVRGNIGSAEIRTLAIKLIPFADSAWEYAQSHFPNVDWLCFDFSFIPQLFAEIDADMIRRGKLPDIPTRISEMAAEHKRQDWFMSAKQWCNFHWCYDGLVDDWCDQFETAFLAGELPDEAARGIGELADLSEIDPITRSTLRKPVFKWEPANYLSTNT